MSKTARLGDKVNMNCPHGGIGTITSASPNVEVNGRRVARETDTVVCDLCGVSRKINAGECSSDVYVNGLQVARVGDHATGVCNLGRPDCPHITTATIIEGSDNTTTN